MGKRKISWVLGLILSMTLLVSCSSTQVDINQSLQNTQENTVEATITPTEQVTEENKEESLKVHFIDVGQADCTLFESNGEFMLVDAGNNADGNLVVNYLKAQGVSTISYLIGTHPHEDHIGGLDTVINNFDIETVIMPEKTHTSQTFEDVLDALIAKDYSITKPVVGDTYTLGTTSFRIIAPVSTYGDELNNWSVGVKVSCGDIDFVLCGDAEQQAESDIVRTSDNLDAEVLKVGHHGSHTSSTDIFLNAVNPNYAVIHVGTGNSYGHPHEETLTKLQNRDIKVFRTDKQGTIIAKTDGKTIEWSTEPTTDYTSPSTQTEQNNTVTNNTVSSNNTNTSASYILNTNTRKFHYPSCSSVSQMAEKNKEYFEGDRQTVIDRGFQACKRCNP